MFRCDYCQYISNKSSNVKREDVRNHNNQTDQQHQFQASFQQQKQEATQINYNYEIFEKHLVKQNRILEKYRLIENDDEKKKNCYCDHLYCLYKY